MVNAASRYGLAINTIALYGELVDPTLTPYPVALADAPPPPSPPPMDESCLNRFVIRGESYLTPGKPRSCYWLFKALIDANVQGCDNVMVERRRSRVSLSCVVPTSSTLRAGAASGLRIPIRAAAGSSRRATIRTLHPDRLPSQARRRRRRCLGSKC